ncbi:MAG: DUF1285 domain-containing protein [Rhodospirillales bacterium]|jgi:hypothetical protein
MTERPTPAREPLAPPDRGTGPTARDERYEIRILTDGTWTYHGSPIRRPELVRLFATVLRRDEAGDHWLITPAERGRIVVDDAPFVAVAAERHGTGPDQTVVFRTNLDETVAADADHPVLVRGDGGTGAPRPYIVVRDGLEARIGRPVFYDLVEWAEVAADGSGIGVWSGGTFFPLGRIDPD